jgi:hypothetical protein
MIFQPIGRVHPVAGAILSRFRRFLARQGLMFTQVIAMAVSLREAEEGPHRKVGI